MIKGVRVTFWMSVKHLLGFHSDYVHSIEAGNKVYWNGGFKCAICGRVNQAFEPKFEEKLFK